MIPPKITKFCCDSESEYADAVVRRDSLLTRGVGHLSPDFFELELLSEAIERYETDAIEERISARQTVLNQGGPESEAYQAQVCAWREAWRPEAVRTLLIAESHVREMAGDTEVEVALSVPTPEKIPVGFCRLVYCLGYGESSICDPTPVKNSGTIQYWDLFGQIAFGTDHLQPRKSESTDEERIGWKLSTLRELRGRGVWLVDASTSPCYASGGKRLFAGKNYKEQLQKSWDEIVWPTLQTEPIESIWIIGKGVAAALKTRPELNDANVISQPQSRNPDLFREELKRLLAAVTV